MLIPLKGKPGEKILKHTRNWNRDLGVDVKKSEIRQTRIHDLRHTYGSWLCQSGIPLRRIQKLMGHESITTTEQYAHLAPSTDEDIASILDEKYRQSIDERKASSVLDIP